MIILMEKINREDKKGEKKDLDIASLDVTGKSFYYKSYESQLLLSSV